MSPKPTSPSQDLQRLWEEGYDLEIRAGYLLVKNVPYVNSKCQVLRGVLATPLTLAGDVTVRPESHVVDFAGEYPCRADGRPIETIRHASSRRSLLPGLEVDHSFSNKPPSGYSDYFEKMSTYATILAGPAEALDPSATARVNRFVDAQEEGERRFCYEDAASSTAGIAASSAKLRFDRIAIVGLGGTGSYVLDQLAKTPIREIHLFDGDVFLQHNAFRAPGAASKAELLSRPSKVGYLASMYSKMHLGIMPHEYFIDRMNIAELQEMSFVFLCVDRGEIKREIVHNLVEAGIPFIDVGLGVDLREGDQLAGVLRVTIATPEHHSHIGRHVPFSDASPNADYSRSIQIADLNALAANLAVIRWKKWAGFYDDLSPSFHTTFTVDTGEITNECAR